MRAHYRERNRAERQHLGVPCPEIESAPQLTLHPGPHGGNLAPAQRCGDRAARRVHHPLDEYRVDGGIVLQRISPEHRVGLRARPAQVVNARVHDKQGRSESFVEQAAIGVEWSCVQTQLTRQRRGILRPALGKPIVRMQPTKGRKRSVATH